MPFKADVVTTHLHTALRVRDFDGAIKFYTEVVGLTVDRVGGPDPAKPTGAWMQGLQLVRAEDQDTSNKGVLDHIGFSVKNIEAIVESLKKNGVQLEEPGLRDATLPNGQPLKLAFFRDPENNRIELTQR